MRPDNEMSSAAAIALVRDTLSDRDIEVVDVAATAFPEETIILAKVFEDSFETAIQMAAVIDAELQSRGFNGFVTIRGVERRPVSLQPVTEGVHDSRIPQLIELLTTRSRTSQAQPSLSYVPDAAANASLITAARHHLVFGRRGAGKTALLLEGKRKAELQGATVTWSNIQTHRDADAASVFLWIVDDLLTQVEAPAREYTRSDLLVREVEALRNEVRQSAKTGVGVGTLVPRVHQTISRFGQTTGIRIYMFLDDFHYLARDQQPELLDLLHRATRDCDVWLKVAAIKHLTRWFDNARHVGLETGHDADHIELDLTLKDPARAKLFLEEVLRRYALQAAISALSKVLSTGALDRLVLASGAVPRDYLTLAARAIQRCRTRPNSRVVGVQDVNAAAGEAAKVKIDELEEDLASSADARNITLEALKVVRSFCIDEKAFTYFRVDFRDKEEKPDEYNALTSLLDVRLLHLLEPSLSDPHQAGERSEVYMLDLSQFSGQRLKNYLRVLDFSHGHFVSRETRKSWSQVGRKHASQANHYLPRCTGARLAALGASYWQLRRFLRQPLSLRLLRTRKRLRGPLVCREYC